MEYSRGFGHCPVVGVTDLNEKDVGVIQKNANSHIVNTCRSLL